MAQFNFNDFEAESQRRNAARNDNGGNGPKIGFFKLAEGELALVRFNISSTDDFMFASVHKPIFGQKYTGLSNQFAGINCLNSLSGGDACPFCRAAAANHPVVDRAKSLVYVPMLVTFKDMATGTWSEAQPVVWERPAGFARELATKLGLYGDLRSIMFIATRTGKSTDTRYSFDAAPPVFKPEMIPMDFSVFDGFKVNRHSFWEKTAEEMTNFLTTGTFPEVNKQANTNNYATPTQQPVYAQPAQPSVQQPAYAPPVQQSAPNGAYDYSSAPSVAQSAQPQPQAQPQTMQTAQTAPKFSNFTF